MIKCSNCHQVLPDVAIFCENCGVRLSDMNKTGITCLVCGAKIKSKDGYCKKCGYEAGTTRDEIDDDDIPSRGKKTLLYIIMVLMFVIVFLVSAILGITLYIKSSNKKGGNALVGKINYADCIDRGELNEEVYEMWS